MPDTATLKPLLTTADCARIAGVSCRTIIDWVRVGRWPDPAINGYRCKRWNRADVERFMKTGRMR